MFPGNPFQVGWGYTITWATECECIVSVLVRYCLAFFLQDPIVRMGYVWSFHTKSHTLDLRLVFDSDFISQIGGIHHTTPYFREALVTLTGGWYSKKMFTFQNDSMWFFGVSRFRLFLISRKTNTFDTTIVSTHLRLQHVRLGAFIFVALGTGAIKPNVMNFGADQYDTEVGVWLFSSWPS